MKLAPAPALLSTLTLRKEPTAVLVGSPISYVRQPSPMGVPLSPEIVAIAETMAREAGLYTQFAEFVPRNGGAAERYVAALEFLGAWIDQDTVNRVVEAAVTKARKTTKSIERDGQPDDWHLTPASMAIGKLFTSFPKVFSGPVLTTNFDPLLSLSISACGGTPSLCILDSDGSLPKQGITDGIPVVHLHGYWRMSDTLHTGDQLTNPRPKLAGSLRSLLSRYRLLIVGCGGWDDIFLQALTQFASESDSRCNVLWAFFENDKAEVAARYPQIFSAVSSLLSKNRFRPYGGIDCHDFFPKLVSAFTAKEAEAATTDTPTTSPVSNGIQATLSTEGVSDSDGILQAALTQDIRTIFDSTSVTSEAHAQVRKFELARAADELEKHRALLIQTTWGVDVSAFLRAALTLDPTQQFSGVVRIDVSECTDVPSVLVAIERDIGLPLQSFAASAVKAPRFCLIFDGIDSWQSDLFESAWARIGSSILDYCENASLAFVQRSEAIIERNTLSRIKLDLLDEAEVREYVTAHPRRHDGVLSSPQLLARLHEISGGDTSQIDRLLSSLEFMPPLQVLGGEAQGYYSAVESSAEVSALERFLAELQHTDEGARAWSVLKALSVLTYGLTFSVIRRFEARKPCHPNHIAMLRNQGLVEVTRRGFVYRDLVDAHGGTENEQVLRSPAAVRSVVAKQLPPEEREEIIKRAATLLLGDKWRQGKIKAQPGATATGGLGNEYIIVTSLVRLAGDASDALALKRALKVGVSLVKALNKQDRWADSVQLARELLSLAHFDEAESLATSIAPHYVYALRMFNLHDESIEYGEHALTNLPLAEDARRRILQELAYCHTTLGDSERAISLAKEVRSMSSKGSGSYIAMHSLIVHQEKRAGWVAELTKLEKRARRRKDVTTANNIAIRLARESSDIDDRLANLRKVSASFGDDWNRHRATLLHVENLLASQRISEIRRTDERTLIQAYSYYFSQHLHSQFSRAHQALFKLWRQQGDTDSILMLSRHSSFFWRLHGMSHEEQTHLVEISPVIEEAKANLSRRLSLVIRYCVTRLRMIRDQLAPSANTDVEQPHS